MTLLRYTFFCLPVLALFALLPISADGYTGQRLAGKAKVTLNEARSIALRARPGTITDGELEKEKGGSLLRYSFDIKRAKRPTKLVSMRNLARFCKTPRRDGTRIDLHE
jgi:hypothetical protein